MAQLARVGARRAVQLPLLDGFVWLVRVAALLAVVWGSYRSLTSGRLTPGQWRDLVVIGLSQGAVYALIALGYTMVYGVLRFINFAHGEVFMTGTMAAFFVADALSRTGLWTDQVWIPLLAMLGVAVLTSTLVAVLLERVAYRPLRGKPRLIPFITAIGASFFLQYAFAGLFGVDVKNFPPVALFEGKLDFFGFRFLKTQLLVIGSALLMMGFLYAFVEKTKTGKAIRAVAEDQEIARLMGIDVDRTIALVFAIGGAMAGAAGFLWSQHFGQVSFRTGFLPGIKAFTAAVLGGIGNIPGAMIGGVVLGLVESVSPSLILIGLGIPAAHQLKDVVAFLALVLVLIFRPMGILGERLAEERA
ncbi:MAG TPA: branched-chain amino acid ABC transporter permease [Actinomycetota bacterium]|nr:branched-chain amino acid ABC transporter permease [Actinomycetota bacterium]